MRPKVLILLPFRSRALKVVNTLVELLFGSSDAADQTPKEKTRSLITNRARFNQEFNPDPDEKESKRTDMPADYKHTFSGWSPFV